MAIVKIVCTHCLKNYGIVIVGVETIEGEDGIDVENVQIPDLPPITTDDVIANTIAPHYVKIYRIKAKED